MLDVKSSTYQLLDAQLLSQVTGGKKRRGHNAAWWAKCAIGVASGEGLGALSGGPFGAVLGGAGGAVASCD